MFEYLKLYSRIAFSIGMFFVGLVIGATIVQQVGGELRPTTIKSYLDYFSTHRSEIDTVHIGTSRFWRHIDPDVFDARMSELGYDTHSMNLSIANLISHEAELIVAEIISSQPHPRIFIVETLPNEPMPSVLKRKEGTDRFFWWRSASLFAEQTALTLKHDIGHREKAEKIGDDLRWTLIREFRIGKGRDILARLASYDEPRMIELERKGFRPHSAEETGADKIAANTRFRQKFEERMSEQYRSENHAGDSEEHQNFRRQILAALPPGKFEVIFVAPAGSQHIYDSSDAGIPALFLNDPASYPDLHNIEKWVDPSHLNAEGAEMFSELLAEAVAEELGRRGQ